MDLVIRMCAEDELSDTLYSCILLCVRVCVRACVWIDRRLITGITGLSATSLQAARSFCSSFG